jgi:hypothetical protein
MFVDKPSFFSRAEQQTGVSSALPQQLVSLVRCTLRATQTRYMVHGYGAVAIGHGTTGRPKWNERRDVSMQPNSQPIFCCWIVVHADEGRPTACPPSSSQGLGISGRRRLAYLHTSSLSFSMGTDRVPIPIHTRTTHCHYHRHPHYRNHSSSSLPLCRRWRMVDGRAGSTITRPSRPWPLGTPLPPPTCTNRLWRTHASRLSTGMPQTDHLK